MSLLRAIFVSAAFTSFVLSAPSGARAQNDDAADTAFWQSIQADNDPAEYKLYLEQFPNGRFARLAQLRIKAPPVAAPPAGQQPAPIAAPAAPATPQAPEGDDPEAPPEHIDVNPSRARVGQIIAFACVDFPNPTTFDQLVVVPAGTPVIDPTRAREDTKVIWRDYAVNCKTSALKGGPFAPGRYEVRFMTTLYNNDGLYQQRTMTPFTVR